VITCEKENVSRTWLYCLLALIGEQFAACDSICGSVLTLGGRSSISIWINTLDKKLIDKTEREISKFLEIARDRMRFQRHRDTESKKSFCIKLSRSVDLSVNNVSNEISLSTSCSTLSVSPSFTSDDEDFTTPFIDLTTDYTQENTTTDCSVVLKECMEHEKSERILSLSNSKQHRKALSDTDASRSSIVSDKIIIQNTCKSLSRPSATRLAISIDSASFRRWRNTELSSKPLYQLPKLHRRRGRRISTDKSCSPNRRRLVVPETIPENKVVDFEVPVLKREEPNVPIKSTFIGIQMTHWFGFAAFVSLLVLCSFAYSQFLIQTGVNL